MSTLKRTILTFAAFILNFYLVATVHQDVNGINQTQHTIVWIVFITMTLVSLIQWDASYLFGSYAYVYAGMIAAKMGSSWETMAATGAAMVMTWILFEMKLSRFISLDGVANRGLTGWNVLAGLFRYVRNRRAIKKIRALVGVKTGGEALNDGEVREFFQVEDEVRKSQSFFDCSDLELEKALASTPHLIITLQKDHARLLLRGDHLRTLLASESRENLEKEIAGVAQSVSQSIDEVEKAQLQSIIDCKMRRIADLEKLDVCLKRVTAQRLQIINTLQGIYHQLNGLKFSDIQTLEASKNIIPERVRQVRHEVDDIQTNLLLAEQTNSKFIA